MRILVEADRTDKGRSGRPSAVVFSSATGALALTRYLSPSDMLDDPDSFRLDIRGFISRGLAATPSDRSALLVLFDPDSEDSRRAMTALAATSSYTAIPMIAVASRDFRNLRPMDLDGFAGVVLACPDVPSAVAGYLAGLLRNHARKGGRVLAVLPIRDPSVASVIWGRQVEPVPGKAKGIRFHKGAFPGIAGLEVEAESVGFSGLRAVTGPDCRVLAESLATKGNTAVPLWWRCTMGKGSITALNAYEFADRAFLGFVVQSVLNAEGSWAMPVLAAAVEFVDDCPLPMTGRFLKPMGKKDTEFYSDDFFGMVLKAVDGIGIRPVFMAVFSYDDRVAPPFDELYPGQVGSVSRELARRIVEHDLLAGLHGMNHLSPAITGGVSKTFPDRESISREFSRARKEFYEVFGKENRPTVYVPPNDYIDKDGKLALTLSVPEVRVIASVFSGSEVETQQDFARDQDLQWITTFPRTWAGYTLKGEALLGMLNGVFVLSVNSHFIHPDDVLDPERSGGRSWKELESGYLDGLREVRRRFPFLREMSVLEAAEELNRMLSVGLKTTRLAGGGIRVVRTSGVVSPLTLLVRLPEGCPPKVSADGKVLFSDLISGRHHVRMDGRVLEIDCNRSSAAPGGQTIARGPAAPRGAR
ncbi:MAG: DUF2194 domain-containing protein [Deltaproteobacteria bacterium]|nr:DUF2194 domain-containing protein [Deltaproteobacteria bacterium]